MGRRDALALAGVVAAGAILFARGLDRPTNYDEGVYLASLDALRHGQSLGTDVFASQPPGFYVLLRLLGAFAGRSVDGIRIGMLVVALVGVAAAYAVGRRAVGIAGGIAAGALVIAAPPYAAEASRVAADVPSVALSLAALAVAVLGLDRRSTWAIAVAAALAAAAISVKLLALPIVVPLVILAWRRGGGARAAAALAGGAAVVVAALAAAYAGAIGRIWDDAVTFHHDARSVGVGESGASRLLDYFSPRTPTTWVVAAAAIAAVAFRRRPTLWAWAVAAAIFLLLQRPLLDHHFVLLAAALGTAAAATLTSLPGRLWLAGAAVAGVGAVAGWAQDYRQLARTPTGEPSEVVAAADAVRHLTRPGELVVSDLPIVPYLADRRLPGDLVDTSAVRFAAGSLTRAEVEAARARVVVVGREFRRYVPPGKSLVPAKRLGSITVFRRR